MHIDKKHSNHLKSMRIWIPLSIFCNMIVEAPSTGHRFFFTCRIYQTMSSIHGSFRYGTKCTLKATTYKNTTFASQTRASFISILWDTWFQNSFSTNIIRHLIQLATRTSHTNQKNKKNVTWSPKGSSGAKWSSADWWTCQQAMDLGMIFFMASQPTPP